MMRSCVLCAALATSALLGACGGEVFVDATTTASGNGGAATTSTTGAGGATTTTSTTTVTTTSATTGCNDKAGLPCPAGQFCDFPDPNMWCGDSWAVGVCVPSPTSCDTNCDEPVVGCDGKFYCNFCAAQASGTDLDPCAMVFPDSYRAINVDSDLPRFVILKASPWRGLCFRLVAELTQTTGIGIFGMPFAITSAEVTNDVTDCEVDSGWPPPPQGESFESMAGAGTLAFDGSGSTCVTSIHAKADFSGGPAWVPASEPFDADGLVIDFGCP